MDRKPQEKVSSGPVFLFWLLDGGFLEINSGETLEGEVWEGGARRKGFGMEPSFGASISGMGVSVLLPSNRDLSKISLKEYRKLSKEEKVSGEGSSTIWLRIAKSGF